MNTIEERLKKLLRAPAVPDGVDPSAAPVEVDYNLISRYAEGTADAGDAALVAALIKQEPELAALVEEPREAALHILRLPRRMGGFLAAAASVVLVAGIGWMVHVRSAGVHPTLHGDAVEVHRDTAVPKDEPTPRAAVSVAATQVPPRPEPETLARPRYNAYALLVGVDRNEHDAALRNGALEDVRQVAAKLREFEFDQVVTLTNALATSEGISGALAALARVAGPNASLFVYCAGDEPDRADLAGTTCMVPFDNAALDAGKNVQVEEKVATDPSLFNNNFIVYDNRAIQTRQERHGSANGTTVQQRCNGLFARAFIEALDGVAAGESISAADVQGYVARHQMLPANQAAECFARADKKQKIIAPTALAALGTASKKIMRATGAESNRMAEQLQPRQVFLFRRAQTVPTQ